MLNPLLPQREQCLDLSAPERVFALADAHERLSSHMSQSSWRMGSDYMTTTFDEGHGRRVGSHILSGHVLGLNLSLDEMVTARQFQWTVNHESGLLGVSGTSSDLRDLLAKEAGDVRAAEAVALFSYQAKKWIGSFTAALGGLNMPVFAGGIGEHAPLVRERICDGLGFLGIDLNRKRNAKNAPLISADAGRVKVRGHPHR